MSNLKNVKKSGLWCWDVQALLMFQIVLLRLTLLIRTKNKAGIG